MKYEIKTVFEGLNYRLSAEDLKETMEFFSEERKSIRDAIERLSWSESQKTQENAIDFLIKDLRPREYIYLVLPGKYVKEVYRGEEKYYLCATGKDKWENAAKTIVGIGWPKIKPILVPLFMWLLDSNWPGSTHIYNLILTLPREEVKAAMNTILNRPQCYEPFDYEDLKELIEEIDLPDQ